MTEAGIALSLFALLLYVPGLVERHYRDRPPR